MQQQSMILFEEPDNVSIYDHKYTNNICNRSDHNIVQINKLYVMRYISCFSLALCPFISYLILKLVLTLEAFVVSLI